MTRGLPDLRSWALQAAGVYRRRLERQPFDGLAVLAYHGVRDDRLARPAMQGAELHVSAARLAEHCRVLKEICTPISADRFLEAVIDDRPLPPRAVLLTFDDGYATWLTHALPVLERFDVPAVMFICPEPVARGIHFWFDAVAAREGQASVDALKRLPYDAWRAETARLELPAAAGHPNAPLTIEAVQELARSPLVEIGGHTLTHPILANASSTQQQQEIAGCAHALAAWTGRTPRLFAYPNGRPETDFSPETVSLVRQSFLDGFAAGDAFAHPRHDRGEHRRFLMLDTITGAELAHRLAGAWPRREHGA